MENDTGESLASLYKAANTKRQKLSHLPSSNTAEYQDLLASTLADYTKCSDTADQVSLFSPNESLDDIATTDIRYLSINYNLADLVARRTGSARKADLLQSQTYYTSFLKLLDQYDILTQDDARLLEQFRESPATFSTASGSDPTARREAKIKRFKAEKELKQRLAQLQSNPVTALDDETARQTYLQEIALAVHQTFQALESIAQELHILSLAPPADAPPSKVSNGDSRDRARDRDGYSDRLDGPLSSGLTGPLLDGKGRPMRPFTLLDKRQELQAGVFRPDHSLPTMSIDEYLEEERRRGGIIEGGGPSSGLQPEPDEDNYEKADAETMKARQWDEFTEENPRGAGNTLNRG